MLVFVGVADPLTLDVYPAATLQTTTFSLYEDDGITRAFNEQHSTQVSRL